MSTQHGRMGRKRAFVKASRGSGAGKRGKFALQMQMATLRGRKMKQSKVAAARVLANATTAGFLGIEKKFLDTCVTPTAIIADAGCASGEYDPSATSGPGGGSGGCKDCLSCPAQGDTEQSRDGKRIVIDSLILKGNIAKAEDATEAAAAVTKVFLAVVLDTQTNGAQLSSENVFKNLSASISLAVDPAKNLLSGNRYRILKSQLFDLTPQGVGPAGNLAFNSVRRDFDWYIPFKGGLPVNLNAGTNADVANVIDNSLHVIAFSTLSGAFIAYNARIRFQG